MKEKGDLILLYTLKELPAAKSHSLTKSIPSFVVDSVSNSDLNSPTSTEKFEPLIDQLTQEVDLNNVVLLKNIIRKIITQVATETCTPETQ